MQLRKIKMAVIRYAFLGSYGSVVLKLMRKFNMEKPAIKEFLFGSLNEILRNRNFYYKGIGAEYSHLTEQGETAIRDLVNLMSWHIVKADEAELDRRAKDMVMAELKK